MKTPHFLISEEILVANILNFKRALTEYWGNHILGYSVKTNSLPWLLNYLRKYEIYAETVSDEEYLLARKCDYKGKNIIYNGPIKGADILVKALEENAIINIDSQSDLDVIISKDSKGTGENIGIRLNIPVDIFLSGDVGYTDFGFRFGFSVDNGEFERVIHQLQGKYGHKKFGLHLHCNSVTRSLDVYVKIAQFVKTVIKQYSLEPNFIDIGGGFFGGVEGKPTPSDYIREISKELREVIDPAQTRLIVEPGSAIIGSAVELHTSVIDVKETGSAIIVTTDGSRVHIDPFWNRKYYRYSIRSKHNTPASTSQVICGYTCMDHDRLMVLSNTSKLVKGDKIIYERVGAYSVTFGGPFIRYFPEVYVKQLDNSGIIKIRERISLNDYYKMQNVRKIKE